MRILLIVAAALLTIASNGCTTLPIDGKLPGSLAAQPVAEIETGSPVAISPDGSVAAIYHSELRILHFGTSEHLVIGKEKPVLLAWSPFGYSLAAVYMKDGKGSITIYDQFGIVMTGQQFDEPVTGICWLSEKELVATGLSVKIYKFGTNYATSIYRWQPGRGVPEKTRLRDSTLQPPTLAKWKDLLGRGAMLACNTAGLQVAYLQPSDPPLFAPHYKLIIRDLASHKELEAATAGLATGGTRFSADGELLLYGDGSSNTQLINPWSEEKIGSFKSPGKRIALSPAADSIFADGSLFKGKSSPIPLAPDAEAQFQADGSSLYLTGKNRLYRLTGLNSGFKGHLNPEIAEKVDKLRSMRLQGLITASEYKSSVEKVLAP